MDITRFVVSRRNDALLVGDYGSYRKQLSRRLLTVRRKLGRASPKGRKYVSKPPVTIEDISKNPEFVHLLLLVSERAWAHAMHMKSMHAADSSAKAITGSTRTHIVSRLQKAKKNAAHLLGLLRTKEEPGSPAVLEAHAYCSMLLGSLSFESQKWEACLEAYAEAHLIYTVLGKTSSGRQGDAFRELLSSTVDPSIRYAAYQSRLPRTLSINKIVERFLSKDSQHVRRILERDPEALSEGYIKANTEEDDDSTELPKTISWRSRTVKLEDANIAQALAAVSAAEEKLTLLLSSATDMTSRDKAAAYEGVLGPSQDAVDATRVAIDELTADGVPQGDQRMQALQITRTAVNYALVGWRIGRNRVLCGKGDGAYLEPEKSRKRKYGEKEDDEDTEVMARVESKARKIARLRERVVLYDNILQSLESIKELPGVAADESLLKELVEKRGYFTALRCLAIGRSHSLMGNTKNALGLYSFGWTQALIAKNIPSDPSSTNKPPNLGLTEEEADPLKQLLLDLFCQHRGLVDLQNLIAEAEKAEKAQASGTNLVIERLDEYPLNGADLSNLVMYPPRVRPIPVKPIFLDVAWNYIDYPGRTRPAADKGDSSSSGGAGGKVDEIKEGRKGWFGFGR